MLDAKGNIPVFVSMDALSAYAQIENIILVQEEPCLHHLDAIVEWLKVEHPEPEGKAAINCNEFLAAWNLFADVSRSIGGNFDADREFTADIYDKLFWGNNLPAVTPEGQCYIPFWSETEERIIRDVMSQGLQMFRNSIKNLPL